VNEPPTGPRKRHPGSRSTGAASLIKEDAEYEGVRVNIAARIGSARLELQTDIGFGDVVTPGTVAVVFPTLLPIAARRLVCASAAVTQCSDDVSLLAPLDGRDVP
jgi:hypothetical protein